MLARRLARAIVAAAGTLEALGTSPLAATGLGAAIPGAGVGVAVVGAVAAAHGTMVGANTLNNIFNGPVQKSDQRPVGQSESTTPTGKTSSGQDINKHGEKLGPSQRPMVHDRGFSTTKGAKDAARQAGKSGPIRDKGHFHATDRSGRKLPNAGHFTFPD